MEVRSSVHQPGTVNENVLESDFVPLSDGRRGEARLQISDFWRGYRFVIVSGSSRVLSLWLFYMRVTRDEVEDSNAEEIRVLIIKWNK